VLQAVRWNSLFSTRSVQSSPPLPSHATLKHLYRYRASLTHHIHPSSGFYAENIATLCTLADTRQAPQVGCVANIPTARCEVVGWSGIGGGHKNAGHSFEMPWRINWRHNPMLLLLTYLRYIPPPPRCTPGCFQVAHMTQRTGVHATDTSLLNNLLSQQHTLSTLTRINMTRI
jgi:hypothetical protein